MNTVQSLQVWSRTLQKLLPCIHQYQVQSLASFSFALARVHASHLSRICAGVPAAVQPSSVLRRLHRLLSNPRLDVEVVCNEMASWLERWNSPSARLIVLLDETPHRNEWRVMKVSIAHRRRSLPLVWRTDALSHRSQKDRVAQVLAQSAALIQRYAPQAQVTLLADRGLCWSSIALFCREQGWHFVLRAQGQMLFRWEDENGEEQRCALRQLLTEKGRWFQARGWSFQRVGWLPLNVVACWRSQSQEAWLLVTDLPPSLHLVRHYRKRMWQEQSFRDEKSAGFHWNQSEVHGAQRVHRLLLLLALAQLWLCWLGEYALAHSKPWRERLGLYRFELRRKWSLFRTGWELLTRCLNLGLKPPCQLRFKPV